MTSKVNPPAQSAKSGNRTDAYIASRTIVVLLILAIASSFFSVIGAGQRGVLMRFGQVQPQILPEGIHFVVPLVHTVQKLSVRVQKQEISAEASSRDLQDIYADVALNWHVIPTEAHLMFQEIGDEQAVIDRIINPAVEEVLKAAIAQYTAEEIITKRGEVKAVVDQLLLIRLANYHIAIDDISLVHVHFSDRFSDAVEAKQIAEQEAKRAGFMAQKAIREAEMKVNLAKGDAEAHQIIRDTLTPEILRRQAIERWDGKLPLINGGTGSALFDLDLEDLVTANRS
ncbi:MAG TPA: prohibitin family protein [Coleofasciculaceae cyanobacterium]|jgi:regulator of protease activity HflC (stomatin/prohibitin superfamily)